jgi:hypothetical protein
MASLDEKRGDNVIRLVLVNDAEIASGWAVSACGRISNFCGTKWRRFKNAFFDVGQCFLMARKYIA